MHAMRVPVLFVTAVLLAACAPPPQGPVLVSSAGQPVYALRYADELGAAARAIGEAQDQEHKLAAGFGAHLDDLKKPDWDLVRAVVDEADTSGKSADFAGTQGEVDSVHGFWGDAKGAVDAKVAGSAQYALKQATCASDCTNLDVGGPAVSALNESMDKELQKRLRASNDACLLLERNRTALGPQNAAALEKLADDVAHASYLVHVELVVARERVTRLLADRGAVQTTLDRFMQDEKAYQSQPGRTDAEKKASDARIIEAGRRKADADAAAVQAQAAAKGGETSSVAATKDYDDALEALRDKIDRKKKGG